MEATDPVTAADPEEEQHGAAYRAPSPQELDGLGGGKYGKIATQNGMFWGVSPILDILGHLHMVRAIREYCKLEDHPETLTGCCLVLGISLEHDPLLSINQSGCLQPLNRRISARQ